MPIITENDPVDGAELKQIILTRISDAMDRDCTLSDDIAYAGFKLDFEIRLKYLRTSSKGDSTLVWGNAQEGTVEDGETASLVDSYETDSPNQAREQHDLPIPVMVKTPSGQMEKKKVKLGRPPKVKA